MRPILPPCTLAAIADAENLLLAAAKARRGKSRRPDVEAWWQRRESEVLRLSEALASGQWRPSGYHFFEIHKPKRRVIPAAPFADRVVHHALCNVMGPLLERSFIARSFSCQIGKGTTAARACCRKQVSSHRFVLKCDVAKFFPSIDHEILLGKLSTKIRCIGALDLCQSIIKSFRTDGQEQACGLPIGNLTSQLWGNFLLDEMDHLITEAEQHGAYLRYTDDFLFFANEKNRLRHLRMFVEDHLASLHMRLAVPKSRILACAEGVPFCGFVFRPGLAPRILGATKRRFENRRKRLRADGSDAGRLTKSVFAWYQFSREGNSVGLRKAWCYVKQSE